MQEVQKITLDGFRITVQGLVRKGPLVGFMMLVLGGGFVYFDHEKKECKQAIRDQAARIDTLQGQMLTCMIDRMEQTFKIKTLEEQVGTLIAKTRRQK